MVCWRNPRVLIRPQKIDPQDPLGEHRLHQPGRWVCFMERRLYQPGGWICFMEVARRTGPREKLVYCRVFPQPDRDFIVAEGECPALPRDHSNGFRGSPCGLASCEAGKRRAAADFLLEPQRVRTIGPDKRWSSAGSTPPSACRMRSADSMGMTRQSGLRRQSSRPMPALDLRD